MWRILMRKPLFFYLIEIFFVKFRKNASEHQKSLIYLYVTLFDE